MRTLDGGLATVLCSSAEDYLGRWCSRSRQQYIRWESLQRCYALLGGDYLGKSYSRFGAWLAHVPASHERQPSTLDVPSLLVVDVPAGQSLTVRTNTDRITRHVKTS